MPRFARSRDNGWIKFFADGGKLQGLDRDIPSKRCSWSHSQLHSMVGCRLLHDGVTIEIQGAGEYHQSDTLTVIMKLEQTVRPQWDTRRIQKKILPKDRFLVVRKPTKHHMLLEVRASNPIENLDNIEDILMFKEEEIGQWLVAEVEVDGLTKKWFLSKEKI